LTSEPFGRCTTNGQLHVFRSVAELHFSPDSSYLSVIVFRLQFVKKKYVSLGTSIHAFLCFFV